MNWDAIGAIGEFVGAIAVLASLAYIAIQVRSGAIAYKTNLRDSSFRSLMEWNYAMTTDESLAWVFHQGVKDWTSLDNKDRVRAIHALYSFFKLFENMYLHYLGGHLDEEMWSSNKKVLFTYGTQPGSQEYLSQRMSIFHPEYQKLLQSMDQSTDSVSDDFLKALHSRIAE